MVGCNDCLECNGKRVKTVLLKTHSSNLSGYDGPVFLPVMNDMENTPDGEVMADIKKNRNPGNHKRFFAFVKQTFDLQDVYDNKEIWRRHLLLNAGHVEEHISPKTGATGYVIKSINWDQLDEIEFRETFTSVVNAFIKWYGHDLNEIQINSILEY